MNPNFVRASQSRADEKVVPDRHRAVVQQVTVVVIYSFKCPCLLF